MTENEVRKYIEELREKARLFGKSGYATAGMEKAFNKSADTIENLLNELELYRAIGTIEDFKALKEKSVAKRPVMKYGRTYICPPDCGGSEFDEYGDVPHCPNCDKKLEHLDRLCKCGQFIDWSE